MKMINVSLAMEFSGPTKAHANGALKGVTEMLARRESAGELKVTHTRASTVGKKARLFVKMTTEALPA